MDARIAPPFMEATDASRLVCVVVVSYQGLTVFVWCCLSLGTAGAGGGGRGNVALSDVYVHSGCVAAQLAVCPVSLFVSVCRSSVSSSSVSRPSIPRWCPVRA